uniref:Erythroid differentiation-related factor 1 n=1 Tax=Cacopsylla melanoneura TaxID=428564 RepID=A0A8D9EM91_9HEMI
MAEEEEKESPVKSTAVVKYSAVYSPITYSRLQCNTDLKQPPSNWYSSYGESFGLQHVIAHSSSGFSSFQMAHMFPDCVGEVDVVSDAENIKKLLKIPYSSSPVSMVVHRVENTLLLDEFDLHSHLLNQSESDWEWMRKLFVEHFRQNMSRENMIVRKNATPNQQSLVSKFLHYSLPSEEEMKQQNTKDKETKQTKPLLAAKEWPCLPEPPAEKENPDPSSTRHKFARNVIWTFEDIQMLLGTDLPIFGGGTHPCLSLRLRDMNKPINVLTGIDYWLDNLMCNVPEVAMCYHLEGIVQKYELVKTEDLPDMENSKFSPKLIRDVAQNILSFLKSNATKAGHTYWLFKGKNEEVVKLYDLTSLCSEELVSTSRNPFTIPVAMLLYRVARNMKYSRVCYTSPGTIRMLLKNCLSLLSKQDYPQLVTSCHYMLADLYIPVTMDPARPNLDEKFQPEEDDLVEDKALCRPPPLTETLSERCKAALHHVSEGLQCLQYFPLNKEEEGADESKDSKRSAEPGPKFANPSDPIPMPFRVKKPPDNTDTAPADSAKSLLCKKEEEAMPTWAQVPAATDSKAWKSHLQMLLYKKACLVYAALAESSYDGGRYGDALKYIEAVLDCRTHTGLPYSGALASYLLGRAGDCCFKAVQDWTHVDIHNSALEHKINNLSSSESNGPSMYAKECGLIPKQLTSIKETMLSSLECYECALELASSDASRRNLWPRLGNIYNELGSMFMNEAGLACQKEPLELTQQEIRDLFVKAREFLGKGISAFHLVRDDANLALLHSNMGRLMRLLAHTNITNEEAEERKHYNQALHHYTTALAVLASRKRNPLIWDTVTWELSTALYNLAVLSQEFAHYSSNRKMVNREDMEREVVDLLQKALKYCDIETASTRQVVYQYRAAIIHHRLASLYHNSCRQLDSSDTKRKLALFHYEKSVRLLTKLENTSDLLRVQLERIALAEFTGERANSTQNKIKALQSALSIANECEVTLKLIVVEKKEEREAKSSSSDPPTSSKSAPTPPLNSSVNSKSVYSNSSVTNESRDRSSIALDPASSNESSESNPSESKSHHTDSNPEASDSNANPPESDTNNRESLVSLLEQRLQAILKQLTKLCWKNTSSPRLATLGEGYRGAYSKLLKKRVGGDLETHLCQVLADLKKL